MKRIVLIGPGASGKSTLARQLGEITGLPVVELDKLFWQPGPVKTSRDQWVELQQRLVGAADTIIFLDFSLARCAWRALRRSSERLEFWLWLLRYRRRSRPFLLNAISEHAPNAAVHFLREPEAVTLFVADVVRQSRP